MAVSYSKLRFFYFVNAPFTVEAILVPELYYYPHTLKRYLYDCQAKERYAHQDTGY